MKLTLLRQNIVRGSVISVLLAVKIASGRDLPPIHFGRADGVERTLLRIACQSETFLAPPWQDDANIRFLWHIGCQSDFDELVLMSFRPVYRGFCRMAETKVPFHPVKSGFGRMGMTLAVIARSKGHPSDGPFFVMFWSRKHIQLGNSAPMSFRHLRSGPSTVSCVLLRRTCLRRTPPHYSRSAHQCAGRAVYFAAAKYGKAGRSPGVATLVAVRGLVPPK